MLEGNAWRGGIFLSLWWMACIAFMSANTDPNPEFVNRQLDYILIAGILPFLILGEWIVYARYGYLNCKFLTSLRKQQSPLL